MVRSRIIRRRRNHTYIVSLTAISEIKLNSRLSARKIRSVGKSKGLIFERDACGICKLLDNKLNKMLVAQIDIASNRKAKG